MSDHNPESDRIPSVNKIVVKSDGIYIGIQRDPIIGMTLLGHE